MRPSLLSSSALATTISVAAVAAVTVAVGVPYVAARSTQPTLRRGRVVPPPTVVPQPVTSTLLPPPTLTVTGADGKPQTLGLSALEVRASIAGPLAQTSLTMTFRNDSDRALEGNLDFPLPENAVLSGYALDNHGVMVDGVPVEKHEARQIFEAEERKGVDPGLIEQTSGNNFRTRVYPLLPHSERTIRVTYVTDLHAIGNDMVYTVPLHWNQTIPLAKFALTVSDNPVAPELTFGGRDTLLPFTPTADGGELLTKPTQYTMEKTLENAAFADDLTVRLPGLAAQTQTAVEQPRGDSTFFAIADAPPVAPTAPVSGLTATGRLHLGVVWDASVSRLHSDTAHELRLLGDALHGTREATVDVTVLRNVADAPRRFVVTNGDTRELVAYLRAVPDDGGTDLSALRLTRGPADFPITAYLLFTDGIDTLAGDPPATVEAPVYAITTDPRANHALLRDLSERSGGAYLNLSERSDPDAVAALGRTPYSLLGVTVSGGSIADVYPNHAQPISGRATATGRLRSPSADVTLVYGYQNLLTGRDQITARHTVTVRQSDAPPVSPAATDNGLVARFWARQRAATLAQQPDRNHDALIALGKEFNIVTSATSLLVLDTLQQYVDYSIEPPASLPALRNQWDSLQSAHQKDDKTARAAKLQSIVALWQEKVNWYEHPPKPEAETRHGMGGGTGGGGVSVTLSAGMASSPRRTENGTQRVTHMALATTDSSVADREMAAGAAVPRPSLAAPAAPAATANTSVANFRNSANGAAAQQAQEQQVRQQIQSDVRRNGIGGYAPADSLGVSTVAGRVAKAKNSLAAGEPSADMSTVAQITIKPWSPNTPYLKSLRAAGPAGAYDAYLRERKSGGYENSPAYYLDCAEFLIAQGQNAMGVRVLTSILDLKLEEPSLVRITAHRLVQLGYRNAGIRLFAEAKRLRPEEPQSYRDLALAYADRADDETMAGSFAAAAKDDNQALTLLNEVVVRPWDGRFPEIETIVLMEANRIAARARANPHLSSLVTDPIDSRLTQNLPCDLRIMLTWNTDETDQDLWVTEPTGEKCYYSFTRTRIGGRISHDFTQGYGPEEYLLKKSIPGKYKIQTNYYGQHSPALDGGTTIQATVITNWGRPTEKRQYLTVRVNQAKDVIDIGSVVR